ncbi:MAG: spore coat protein [Bacillota bacterium]
MTHHMEHAGQGVQMHQMQTAGGANLLTDKNILSDCLASQKFLAACYNHAVTESANESLRRDFMGIYQEEQNNLKAVFDVMTRQGWYNLNYANPQDIAQVQHQFQQEMAQGGQPQNFTAQHQYQANVPAQQFNQYGVQAGQFTPHHHPGFQQPYRNW